MPALLRTGGGSSRGHAESDEVLDTIPDPFVQNLFVLCHGEQVKFVDGQSGAAKGVRPWDPPLTERGKLQTWRVGREIRLEDWNITRVVMAPSLRCVQTAVEVISGMCMLPSSVNDRGNASPWISTIKASIEFGLAETTMGRGEAADKDSLQPRTLDLAELYSMLPTEIQDPSFQPIRQKLPLGRESLAEVRYRYTSTFQKIANRYPYENVLCITSGEGVMQSVSMMWPRAEVYGVTYCAYTHAQRPNFKSDDDSFFSCDWELLTESGSASGVFLLPTNS